MAQDNTQRDSTVKDKTSTGLPVDQPFTSPLTDSARSKSRSVPQRDVFKGIFSDSDKSPRPISQTVARPMHEVFSKLQDVGNFPLFFERLERVEKIDETNSRWKFKGAGENSVPMRLESSMKGNLIVWKSQDVVGFPYTLAIHLEPAQADRGTVVRMITSYDSVGGEIVGFVEKLFGKDASMTAKKNLQRFKAYCETGHVPTTEGQPSGRDEDSHVLSSSEKSTTLKH